MKGRALVMMAALAVLTLGTATTSWGKGFAGLTGKSSGQGEVAVQGHNPVPVSTASVDLKPGGQAEIQLVGASTYVFTGQWSGGGDQTVELKITGGFGPDGAKGQGKVHLYKEAKPGRGAFKQLEIQGKTKGVPFNLYFMSGEPGAPAEGKPAVVTKGFNVEKMDTALDGGGLLETPGRPAENLTRVRVTLTPDKHAEIKVHGASVYLFTGTWSGGKTDTIDVVITSGFDAAGAQGTGKIYLGRPGGGFERVDIRGTTKGGAFSLRFDSRE